MSRRNLHLGSSASLGCLLLGLVMISFMYVNNQPNISPATSETVDGPKCAGLKLNNQCFSLERAETNSARIKGLSDRDGLPANTGMLFVFENSEEQCFWMKDMRFSIDMIWVNENKKIIKIDENVQPETYPATFCAEDTRYVLEFESGFAEKYGLKTGTELKF